MNRHSFLFLSLSLLLSGCVRATGQAGLTPTEARIIMPTPRWTGPTCSSFELQPTPAPGSPSLFPPVSGDDHVRGAADPSVVLVVYNDFQCSDCNYLPLSQTLLERHPHDLRIVYRHYPYLAYFDKAELAARAAEAAALQGKFWEMHDLLFEQQTEWASKSPAAFESWLSDRSVELGLDQDQFEADYNSPLVVERVQAAAQQGAELGIPVLPFFLRNGQIYTGPTDTYSLDRVISLTALGSKQYGACPPFVIYPDRQYLATLQTEHGQVVLELFPDSAPLAVNSFVFLAREGWYDGITFHNVVPGYAAQTGDPSATGLGNPGYLFENEKDTSLKFDRPGRVAMFNTGPDTNGSQFFITYQAAPDLNGNYTIFGQVLSGMQILEQLSPREEATGQLLPPGDPVISVTRVENRLALIVAADLQPGRFIFCIEPGCGPAGHVHFERTHPECERIPDEYPGSHNPGGYRVLVASCGDFKLATLARTGLHKHTPARAASLGVGGNSAAVGYCADPGHFVV